MRRLILLLFSVFVINTVAQAAEPLRTVCAVGRSADWKFCAHEYANSSRQVLWYFHGIMGSERDWRKHELERTIAQRWIDRGLRPPIVVSVSFGPIWLMTDKLYEFFFAEAVPEIESRVLRYRTEKNWLLGVSMGGFNAAQIYFKNPKFFTRAALLCGAMTLVYPFASPYTAENYIRRTGAWPVLAYAALAIMRSHMPSVPLWLKHSPVDLGRARFSSASKPLYVANGTSDEFGFHEGNIEFARLARDRGVPVESAFYPGRGHCHLEAAPVADFFFR